MKNHFLFGLLIWILINFFSLIFFILLDSIEIRMSSLNTNRIVFFGSKILSLFTLLPLIYFLIVKKKIFTPLNNIFISSFLISLSVFAFDIFLYFNIGGFAVLNFNSPHLWIGYLMVFILLTISFKKITQFNKL